MSDPYCHAGVDITAGYDFVTMVETLAQKTKRPEAPCHFNGFGAVLDPRKALYTDPLLIVATDGVGTKLRLAAAVNDHRTIGIDVVAMCVNDIIVSGAKPFAFLDYYASSHLDHTQGIALINGIIEGCQMAECALVGGETAEMPGFYAQGEYDIAGFALGWVERNQLLPKKDQINPGDRVLGLVSNGIHANGFTLVRQIIEDQRLDLHHPAPFAQEMTLAQALLQPTHIYVKSLLPALQSGQIKALAHITGGGLIKNIPRVLPSDKAVTLDMGCWKIPSVFKWIAQTVPVQTGDMVRIFNCGIGMVAIVAPYNVQSTIAQFQEKEVTSYDIGYIREHTSSQPRVQIEGKIVS